MRKLARHPRAAARRCRLRWLSLADAACTRRRARLPAPRVSKSRRAPAFAACIAQLGKQGVLAEPRAVSLYLRAARPAPEVKAGTYEFPPHASPARLFEMLEQGVVVLEQLTVVEGSTFAELRRALEKHPAVLVTLRGKSDAEVMAAIGHARRASRKAGSSRTPIGSRRAPPTWSSSSSRYDSMARVLDEAWEQRDEELPIHTPYEALILASIVEKETALAAERAQDRRRVHDAPAARHAPADGPDRDLRHRRQVRRRHPHARPVAPTRRTTRTRAPVCRRRPSRLPGRESVLAAVQPEETGALFFVATGDGTGAHYFSKTLEEHNEAVRRYLARLRQQRSPPKHTTTQTDP